MAIYGLGETLLDVIFKNHTPMAAKPGGSVLNALVSLSRMSCSTYLITDIGSDEVGRMIELFLDENGIKTNYLTKHTNLPTTLAMAFLNDKNDATYQFYKSEFAIDLNDTLPPFSKTDYFLFGSTLAIDSRFHPKLSRLLSASMQNDVFVYYDPNCRKSHINDKRVLDTIFSNMQSATLVRCSDEDLINIFGQIPLDKAVEKVRALCTNLVVTRNSQSVLAFINGLENECPIAPIKPVSTIGAGDNFNAGLLYGFSRLGITKNKISSLTKEDMDSVIAHAIAFSAEVCLSFDNYIAKR